MKYRPLGLVVNWLMFFLGSFLFSCRSDQSKSAVNESKVADVKDNAIVLGPNRVHSITTEPKVVIPRVSG